MNFYKSHPKEFYAWYNMISRCYKQHNKQYKNYGARGIEVCPHWKKSFKNFYNDMGDSNGLSLERINNNGNYCKENCRWATIKEQQNNKRTNLAIKYKGKTQNLRQWCDELNLNYSQVQTRIYHGCPTHIAFTTKPKKQRKQLFTYKGKTQNLYSWCAELKLPYLTIYKRIFIRGWSFSRAVENPVRDNGYKSGSPANP